MKLQLKHIFLFCALLFNNLLQAQAIRFIENKGQWENQVLFKADIPGGDLFITNKGLVYHLMDEKALHEIQHDNGNGIVKGHALFVDFVGAQPVVGIKKYDPYSTIYNYYLGNNAAKWASNVQAFQRVVLTNVYPNIDFEITGVDAGVKTAFIVRLGANINQIKLHYRGNEGVNINPNQSIQIKHSLGAITELAPETFIKNRFKMQQVASAYVVNNDTVSYQVQVPKGISIGDTVYIDPSIVFSTFSGSVADNFGFTATFDKNGNAYSGGTVYAAGFPTSPGAYQSTFAGGVNTGFAGARDCGILKFSADGKNLLYATYLGGSNNEQPHSMTCDDNGVLYIMGTTQSINFPVIGGYDNSHNGDYDVFVTRLNATGTALLNSTYLGGLGSDGYNDHTTSNGDNQLTYNFGDNYRGDIRLDANGNVYVATVTQSITTQNLPRQNAFQNMFGGGGQDGWVFKMNGQLNSLLFSSYLGGISADACYSIVIDNDQFFVTGGTNSNNMAFAPTSGVFMYHGGTDGFVAKISQNGGYSLTRTVYLGTSFYDQSFFISKDSKNRIYVTGQTTGPIARVGNVYYELNGRQFIIAMDNNLNSIVLQTAFGAGELYPKLAPSAFMVDFCDRVYLSGWGGGTNRTHNSRTGMTTGLITSADAYQKTTDGSDFYLIIFNKELSSIGYATYFGGNISQEHVDGGTSHFDESGAVYQSVCAGCGGHSDFPTTPSAYSRTNNGVRPYDPSIGGCNNAVFKFNIRPNPVAPVMQDTLLTVTNSDTLNYEFLITDANNDSIAIIQQTGIVFDMVPNNAQLSLVNYQPGKLRMKLTWPTACLTYNDTLTIQLRIKDFNCESSLQSTGNIRIVVIPAPRPQLNLGCLNRSGDEDVVLKWNGSNVAPEQLKYIKRLNIYRSINNAVYDSINYLNNIQQNQYTDIGLVTPELINYCYRLVTVNVCEEKSNPSREACTLAMDSIDTNAYIFSRDSIFYAFATIPFSDSLVIIDRDASDSVYVNYQGSLTGLPSVTLSHRNGFGSAAIHFKFKPECNQVGDTLELNFGIQDNRCPKPVSDYGRFRVVILPAPPAESNDLKCPVYVSNNQLDIKWQLPLTTTHLKNLAVIMQKPDGSIQNLGKFDLATFNTSVNINSNPFENKYCFALVAHNNCDIPTDTGTFTCTPWDDNQYPKPAWPHYITVVNNEYIQLAWPAEHGTNPLLYRYQPATKEKVLIKALNNSNDSVYNDVEVNVQKQSYCYVIEPINECGLRPKANDYACSILLQGKSEPFEHSIWWNDYHYFATGTDFHAVNKRDLTENDFSLLIKGSGKVERATDNTLNKQTGIFYYYIEAAANAPSTYTSRSNTIELIQAPLLHVPNAFTPNNDNNNDTWGISPVFVKEYSLKVYDRWGRLVFETTDKNQQMTGLDQNGNTLPNDVYAYVVTYSGFDGSFKQRTGNLTILK
ncbi:MAG: gliding motility-associated C-terminal domain-containing protein [Bacteroidota bacterium]